MIDRLKTKTHFRYNDIECTIDPSTTRQRNVAIGIFSSLMVGMIGFELNVAEVAISDFRNASPHKVVKVK